jgi:hypothetical protein
VPGGQYNLAGGAFSFAAGLRAKAQHPGSFVWADSQDTDFSSTRDNEFNLRAAGGVRLESGLGISLNAADAPLITRGHDPFTSGAYTGLGRWGLFMENMRLAIGIPDVGGRYFEVAKYAANGTSVPLLTLDQGGNLRTTTGVIGTISDRSLKTDFAPVDGCAILERLVRLPMQTWRFKDAAPQERHLGPVAQDFHATFGVGLDERTICTVDADGVALAAIQGLNEKVEVRSQKAEDGLRRLMAENAELKQEVAELRRLMTELSAKVSAGGR